MSGHAAIAAVEPPLSTRSELCFAAFSGSAASLAAVDPPKLGNGAILTLPPAPRRINS